MKQFKLFFITFFMVLGLISCQKNEIDTDISNDIIDQEVISEMTFMDIDALTEEILDFQFGFLKSAGSDEGYSTDNCPVVTRDNTSMPRKVVLDYGSGCEGKDGKTRSGKIIITSTAFENLKLTRTKTFEDFKVDGMKIEGKITKTFTVVKDDHTRISVIEEDLKITGADNKTATRTGKLTREHFIGNPANRADDKLTTWGKIESNRMNGIKFTKTIAENNPLVFVARCKQIVSGVVAFSSGDKTWSIDYGKGECDNVATATRNGETKIIKLRKN